MEQNVKFSWIFKGKQKPSKSAGGCWRELPAAGSPGGPEGIPFVCSRCTSAGKSEKYWLWMKWVDPSNEIISYILRRVAEAWKMDWAWQGLRAGVLWRECCNRLSGDTKGLGATRASGPTSLPRPFWRAPSEECPPPTTHLPHKPLFPLQGLSSRSRMAREGVAEEAKGRPWPGMAPHRGPSCPGHFTCHTAHQSPSSPAGSQLNCQEASDWTGDFLVGVGARRSCLLHWWVGRAFGPLWWLDTQGSRETQREEGGTMTSQFSSELYFLSSVVGGSPHLS